MEDGQYITWKDVPIFLDTLKARAGALLRRERNAQSLQPTALVLSGLRRQKGRKDWADVKWEDEDVFLRCIYRAMKCALIDHHKRRNAKKRRKVTPTVRLSTDFPTQEAEQEAAISVIIDTIGNLQTSHPHLYAVIQHRFFDGLSVSDCAHQLRTSEASIKRYWRNARLILQHAASKDPLR